MPEISGVIESPSMLDGRLDAELSITPFTPRLNFVPGASSGRVVLMFTDAPMPPVEVSARLVLYTSTAATDSEARFAKSNEREFDAKVSPMLAPRIWRPVRHTGL